MSQEQPPQQQQQQQQQQLQQTPLVYPVSDINPPSKHESNGSFGAVFIVLAVIVVISAIACFLGRLCNKRHNKSKPSKKSHGASRPSKEKDAKHTKNAFQTKDGDIEFGFDKRFSSAKVAANGEPNMGRPNSFREPNMGGSNPFREPVMGRPNSFREPNMGGSNQFREPAMGRANSGRKGEFRGDQVRFGGDQDHEMEFKNGRGPQHY